MNLIFSRARQLLAWVTCGFEPAARPLAALRILLALQILLLPRDISWVSAIPDDFFNPPPGPMALFIGPASGAVVLTLEISRGALALLVLVGWHTQLFSILLAGLQLACSGFAYSFTKVDHFILYDLAPLALGLAGWGAAWSIDAWQKKAKRVDGYPMFLYALTVGFAMFSAALPKSVNGWLSPFQEATRGYVARDGIDAPTPGVLRDWILSFDSVMLWKSFDYATLLVEGGLIFAVLLPGLFRLGLIGIMAFHVGVLLMLGIDFSLNIFAYAGFFMLAPKRWFPEVELFRRRRRRRSSYP